MKITFVAVSSLDGKTTMWNNPLVDEWTSKEDTKHFTKLLQTSSLILMGRKTYQHAKKQMTHRTGRLRLVFTKTPHKFRKEHIKDQLEFTNESPNEALKRLKKYGYKQALFVGGATLAAEFLQQNLLHEIFVTIEPKLFGIGKSLIGEEKLNVNLKLLNVEKLNSKGTLLLKYKVIK